MLELSQQGSNASSVASFSRAKPKGQAQKPVMCPVGGAAIPKPRANYSIGVFASWQAVLPFARKKH